MTTTREVHYVTFVSPGTLVPETTTRPIAAWDPRLAVELAESVRERYGARPYGFTFETHLEGDPVPDGRGGTLAVRPRKLCSSAFHFLGGRVETLDEVEARAVASESILRSNMRGNGIAVVLVNSNSYRATLPFEAEHLVVDAVGAVVERGDDPRWVAAREKLRRENEARR